MNGEIAAIGTTAAGIEHQRDGCSVGAHNVGSYNVSLIELHIYKLTLYSVRVKLCVIVKTDCF